VSAQIIGSVPTCPTCKRTVYSGDVMLNDGEQTPVTCDGCGREYLVRLEITYDYICESAPPSAPAMRRGEQP